MLKRKNTDDLTHTVEDYIRNLYFLDRDGNAITTKIAVVMNVVPSTVTKMVKRLDVMGYVKYTSHRGVKLSRRGKNLAIRLIRKYRIAASYMHNKLGFSIEDSYKEACLMEHGMSDFVEDRLFELLKNPAKDPLGHPIPTRKGFEDSNATYKLDQVEAGQNIKIDRIESLNEKFNEYIKKLDLQIGKVVKITEKHEFGGPIIISDGKDEKMIGIEAAAKIYVEIVK